MQKQQEQLNHNALKINHLQPAPFDYETTNQKTYQPYKIANRPNTAKPQVDVVKTRAPVQHFNTNHKNEFVVHQYKVPETDFIPYP